MLSSSQKVLSDLQVREEERVHRETEICKDLSPMNKMTPQNFALCEKHFRKMIRKILSLTFDKVPATGTAA